MNRNEKTGLPQFVIVQAGGKGSRLKYLTANRPKALVPIGNKPMLFHLFDMNPDAHYLVIGDYKGDVLHKYLDAFSPVDYEYIDAAGKNGTCSGLRKALERIPNGTPFLLIWCDLVLPPNHRFPLDDANYVGISTDFPCRWKYENGEFAEERSVEHGVAGYFSFKDKSVIADVPEEGEFVRYLGGKNIDFKEWPLSKTHEYGLIEEWEKLPKNKTRPFNAISIQDGKVYKTALDQQGEALAKREAAWYKKANELGIKNIPAIYQYEPLVMEKIEGTCIYETKDLPVSKKKELLEKLVQSLKDMHALNEIPADESSFRKAFLDKTFDRLSKIQELVPFAKDETILVNGKPCRNPFFVRDEIEKLVMGYLPKTFCFIHGDCTFSNTMVRNDGDPVFIDPRGYFGDTELYGDPAYDWAKLYYSLYSDYDMFNLKRFHLTIGEGGVQLEIDSNGWRDLEDDYLRLLAGEMTKPQLKLYLALIWLSLTTYAWEDYDSICGAFYNGCYYLEETLELHE